MASRGPLRVALRLGLDVAERGHARRGLGRRGQDAREQDEHGEADDELDERERGLLRGVAALHRVFAVVTVRICGRPLRSSQVIVRTISSVSGTSPMPA